MARKFNIGNYVSLLLGVVIAFAILSQSVQVSNPSNDSQEQADSETPGSTQVAEAIPGTSSQINLGFDSYLLDIHFFDEEADKAETSDREDTHIIHRTIQVIIEQIITPNAP